VAREFHCSVIVSHFCLGYGGGGGGYDRGGYGGGYEDRGRGGGGKRFAI
jgi:hypothetical protein